MYLDSVHENLKDQTGNQLGLYLFCCSIGVIWTVYVLFFNSRVIGAVTTFLLNLYLKRYSKLVWIRIRSVSISFLSGKIMFRGVHYVTVDYMVYIQDGWITFAYWKPNETESNIKESMKMQQNKETNYVEKRTARLRIFLSNLQIHYYNSWKFDSLDNGSGYGADSTTDKNSSPSRKLFSNAFVRTISSSSMFQYFTNPLANSGGSTNSQSQIFNNSTSNILNHQVNAKLNPKTSLINNLNNNNNATGSATNNNDLMIEDLMQLFSVVNIRIEKGRVFAGNSTLPSTLAFKFSNAKMELVTEKSQSKDVTVDFCFILKGDINKLEVSFLPNKKHPLTEPQYANPADKKPVLVFRCVSSDFKYVQDVPSILTMDRRYLQKNETGELIQNEKEPQWGLTLNCNKHTIINYGPWFDRQREALWKFFFPQTYEKLEPQPEPTLNERRQTSKFDFKLKLKDPNTELNVLFASHSNYHPNNVKPSNINENGKKYSEKKLTLKCRSESVLDISIPWLTKQYGYKTKIYGTFNKVESQTNLSFKDFLSAEQLILDVNINYPLIWNDLQTWNINIDLEKTSFFFVFVHKFFFQDMINDWSSRHMSDLRSFVPYIYSIALNGKDIEAILPCNQHNWIDTHTLENNSFFEVLAARGELKFDLKFDQFLPPITNYLLDIQLSEGCARFIIPPSNSNLALLKILKKKIRYVTTKNGEQTVFERKNWSKFNQNKVEESTNVTNNLPNNDNTNLDENSEKKKQQENHTRRASATLNKKNSLKSKSKLNATAKANVSGNINETPPNTSSNNSSSKHNKKNKFIPQQKSTHFSENWFECMQATNVRVEVNFEYNPCPILDWKRTELPSVSYLKSLNSPNFDCEIFRPDLITLKIEIGPSCIMLYGTFLKRLWYIKEGYFGWDQYYTEYFNVPEAAISKVNPSTSNLEVYSLSKSKNLISQPFYDIPVQLSICNQNDPRNFRPLSVDLSLALHQISGHLVLDTTSGVGDVPFPMGCTNRLALELVKTYRETKLQLYVDPVNLFIEDNLLRKYDKNLSQGHLCLSSVQVRGHAMFSDEDRLKTDTLEYAWLLEILLGDVTGSLTFVQTEQMVHGLETLILSLLLENEFQIHSVFSDREDPGLPYKYEVTRFSLDMVDVYFVEAGTALNFNLFPVRLSICNSHTEDYAKGLSACVGGFKVILFINEASHYEEKPQTISKATSNSTIAHGDYDVDDNISISSSVTISSMNSTTSSESLNLNKFELPPDASIGSIYIKNKAKINLNENFRQNSDAPRTYLDSNEFNYWFESSSLATGEIKFDLVLDKGNPVEQKKFLRQHDLKNKWLYFLWGEDENSPKLCGCVGGCYFYSVFDEKESILNHSFFKMNTSITRMNPNFADSLFFPGTKILDSQEMMKNKYNFEFYNYKLVEYELLNQKGNLDHTNTNYNYGKDAVFEFDDKKDITIADNSVLSSNSPKNSTFSSLSSSRSSSIVSVISKNDSIKNKSNSSLADNFATLKPNKNNSTFSLAYSDASSRNPREDDYFTADEDTDSLNRANISNIFNDNDEFFNSINSDSKKLTLSNKTINDYTKKLNGIKSKQDLNDKRGSFMSVNENNNLDYDSSRNDLTLKKEKRTKTSIKNLSSTMSRNENSTHDFHSNNVSDQIHSKMALNFDIQRPILDSSLPKYCYLKYLSRASVENWNQICLFPYFDDFRQKNIFFRYRQKGIDFSNISTLIHSPTENQTQSKDEYPKEAETSPEEDGDSVVKCRINLNFSTLECYITPLALTGLERFTQSIKTYLINPNSLITELEAKAQAHCASNSIIEVISKTQVSLKIPQIRLFSLQCGLAEGDKVLNAFADTLANPDEFITLSLFAICIYSIETQLIDSASKTAAIFQIDKIDTQFCRLYESEKDLSVPDLQEPNDKKLIKSIKLSCISDEHSKTSIRCFKKDNKLDSTRLKHLKSIIMYECGFEEISIKAIKKLKDLKPKTNVESKENDNNNTSENEGKFNENNRLSLFEFNISKIWFSFPEPPTSPKGKRKIPFSRFDWNLLSSVSPAVTSWLCACKHSFKPLKECMLIRERRITKILSALIIGSLKHKDQLEKKIEFLLKTEVSSSFKTLSDMNMNTRSRNKSSSKSNTTNGDDEGASSLSNKLSHYNFQNFLQLYLTSSSLALYNDPNCRFVNILRNYLFYFEDEFNADMEFGKIPDSEYLKAGINEVLNSWSVLILNSIFKKSIAKVEELLNFETINENQFIVSASENFKFFPETRENPNVTYRNEMVGSPTIVSLNEKSNISTHVILNEQNATNVAESLNVDGKEQTKNFKKEGTKQNSKSKMPVSPPQYKIVSHETLNLNDINNTNTNNETFFSASMQHISDSNIELGLAGVNPIDNKHKNIKSISGQVVGGANTPTLMTSKKTNIASAKIFRPILNFIGIDAPSGTLMDNLFKEFGSLISGNLNIKSVDINILGKQPATKSSTNFSSSFSNDTNIPYQKTEPVKMRSFYTSKKSNFFNTSNASSDKNDQNRVITTILSFDSLLFNLNVRQVFPPSRSTNKCLRINEDRNASLDASSKIGTTANKGKNDLSMMNPLYVAAKNENEANLPLSVYEPKYYTKIDTGIQLNNLSQEVNMPLLRLVHQLYSLIADAIEFDKEPNKSEMPKLFLEPNVERFSYKSVMAKPNAFDDVTNVHQVKFNKIDNYCWQYIENIIEPSTRYMEKNETETNNNNSNLSSMKKTPKLTKYSVGSRETLSIKEQNIISFFGWMYIKRVNSKAGLGTLAFNGEMNDIQFDIVIDQKIQPNQLSKIQYEGSANLCISSTLGKLTENDTKQNVVQMSLGKSHVFGYLKNLSLNSVISSFVHIGQIYIDVPLRPMVVHGVVYRESKVIEQKILPEIKNFVIFENEEQKSDNEKEKQPGEKENLEKISKDKILSDKNVDAADATRKVGEIERKISDKGLKSNVNSRKIPPFQTIPQLSIDHSNKTGFLDKFTFQLKSKLDGCEIRAKLLETPCLKAAYIINNVECNAYVTNEKSKISCFLHSHCLSFECDDDLLTKSPTHSTYTNSTNPNTQQNSMDASESSSSSFKQDGMMTMKSLDKRTNFFLPSIFLAGNHVSTALQMENLVEPSTESPSKQPSKQQQNEATTSANKIRKSISVIEVKFNVKIAPLHRELNAQVIAQLVFVTKVFIKEMNFILQAVYGLEDSLPIPKSKENSAKAATNLNQQTHLAYQNMFTNRLYYNFKIEVGKLSLTGITPSNTALTIYTGAQSLLILNNNSFLSDESFKNNKAKLLNIFDDLEYTYKPSIEAKVNLSVELKTSFSTRTNEEQADTPLNLNEKMADNEEVDEENALDWYQLAYFNTKFDLRNAVKAINLGLDRESIIITVEKPRFYLQPGAVDCAILFWLNYKSTYEYWLQQRQQFADLLIDKQTVNGSLKNVISPTTESLPSTSSTTSKKQTASSQEQPIISNYLTLKLRVTGLGLALPLSNKMTKDFFKTNTDCLIITLNETVIYACSSGCVVSKGQFNNFCLRFSESFNLSSSEWTPALFQEFNNKSQMGPQSAVSSSNTKRHLINAWVVPSGNYEVCSSTIEKIKPDHVPEFIKISNLKKQSPIWLLSVKWKMEGIEVNLDTGIGKWLSKLADTVTRLAETQNITETSTTGDQDIEIKRLKKELSFYMEKGDTAKINQIQNKLDKLNLASYPERAKQIFVKTRNTFKGQLGFNTNHPPTTTPNKQNAPPKISSNKNPFNHENSLELENNSEFLDQTSLIERPHRKHSLPNDAENLQNLKNSLPEENETESDHDNQIVQIRNGLIGDTSTYNRHHGHNNNPNGTLHGNNYNQIKKQPPQIETTTPAIDFKLNVKIDISSGKCVLHANKNGATRQTSGNSPNGIFGGKSGAESLFSSNFNPYNSNIPPNFMSFPPQNNEQDIRNTNFIFPAIGVKAFYESNHKKIDNKLAKKANLYAMIKLESFVMPQQTYGYASRDIYNSRDMCITPALLDFLEQTLEPFDLIKASFESAATATTPAFNKANRNIHDNNMATKSSSRSSSLSTNDEFIDTNVNISNSNNSIVIKRRVNINEHNNNELALLQQQETTAYFPIDVVVFVSMFPSSVRFTCLPHSTMECLLKLPSLEMIFSTNRLDDHFKENLSSKLNAERPENLENIFKSSKKIHEPYYSSSSTNSSSNEGGLSVTCSMTDFSLKFYNRLGIRNQIDPRFYYNDPSNNYTEEKDSLSVKVAYIKVNISRTRRVTTFTDARAPNSSFNDVRLSVLADIGSSSFIYDMRNIKEVFVFPKIWYRRSLARRLFLGEESVIHEKENHDKTAGSSHDLNENFNYKSNQNENKNSKNLDLKRPKTLSLHQISSEENVNAYRPNPNWKTLVLISINLVGLDIKMNVGSIMGNVGLVTKNARAISKISISRYGPKDMLFNLAIESSKLIAEGGSNACLLRIQDITTTVEISDKNKLTNCPSHKIDFGIFATECRIDSAYNQATPILAFRLSNLTLKLNDTWGRSAISNLNESDEGKIPEALLELNATWDQLHLMITRSTTPDLIILYYKLLDFFEKQFTESKDYIKECELDLFYEMKVKQQFIEKKEMTEKKNLNCNGGNIQLKGNNFTLITFHGTNFKAKKWAVFSLNGPSMDFSSETYFKNSTQLQHQNICFYLGRNERKRDMASIYMVYRDSTSIFTQFSSINEWFEYSHSSIDAVGLRDFPRFKGDEPNSIKKNKANDQTKWEEIFHLPSLQIICDSTQENNAVKFEFKTDFHDHILLSFLTGHFGFLHELITLYVKEKEVIKGKEDFIPNSKKDDRTYECVKWELEPTLRLISKFGSSVEPTGVDALLKSLGFHHARSTIPKWCQRGLLDNLDEVMQKLIKVYLKILSDYDLSLVNNQSN